MISRYHKIATEDNLIRKELAWPLWHMPEWFEAYTAISAKNKHLVKVYSAAEDGLSLEMEHLDILCTLDKLFHDDGNYYVVTKDLIRKIMICVSQTMITDVEYAQELKNDQYFVHNDLTMDNIVVTKDLEIKIIDPDSYVFCWDMSEQSKYYETITGLGFRIQRHYAKKNRQNSISDYLDSTQKM